ncbi:atrial natriuretic peptide receptor 1-like isoform X3 [Haliotis rufescens]|uniref:atrial natriuretic peptide receptor 1-like isoform X3 n=1 Tax=Haliotis rufescens TaxID=6454 RepID=UPI00201F31ED|nr:atrial natriuretic peptide receptor 1-like isoform X3 [Haliotis rufescens]
MIVLSFLVLCIGFVIPADMYLLKAAVLLPFDDARLFSMSRIEPAVALAVHDLRKKKTMLHKHHISVHYEDSKCDISHGINKAIELYMRHEVHVFFGPVCDFAAAPVARQARFWNLPVISGGAMARDFSLYKDGTYSHLTRVGPVNFESLSVFFDRVLSHFGWNRLKLLYQSNGQDKYVTGFCHLATEALHYGLEDLNPNMDQDYFRLDGAKDLDEIIKHEVGLSYSVIVLCASPDSVREIMIKAHELNFDNGEYVFFNIDLFSSKNASERPWYRENDTEARNKKARLAYEALMTVTLRKPTSPEYRRFSEEVKRRAAQMYKNFTYGEEEVNSFVGAFHDAVILYALALNETLEANGSISDGAAITRRMWNRTFEGITGTVSIDANGDRNADYSLLDLNPESEKYEVVANYYGNRRRYEPVAGKRVYWAGGLDSPPADTPECGFDGSKCPPDEPFPEYGIVIIVLGSVLLVVLIVTFFVYRHIRLEAELAEMNWRVRWDDIMFGAPEKNRKLERQGSRYSLNRRYSYVSDCSRDTIAVQLGDVNRQLFTKTGYFRGAIIAIKTIARQHITIHKPLLLEVKKIKDLQNDHLVRFIGACIDPPHQCILTEYCPKGSLQDVLENEQIKLDWMFRYSIMQDIVRGMAYLHSTDVHCHGNLKSTNCVVDSRFVVKITDFGLHYFRETDDDMAEDTYAYYRSKLWSAPELLRMNSRPPEGTTKGDVYSFAIICQEIVYRNGVFYLHNLDVGPQEVIEKLKSGLRPYFRPTIEEFDCPCDELAEVIKRCWAEDPAERPDFQSLKTIIRKLNKEGDKGDILDNLLSRMEQYANNLEALVEERTSDYLEQKKRAEDLLYMMLPRSVANQLVKGESVAAESYEQVTIYFSDICGFTAMSAESTPMQVIALLNDLYTTFDSIIENFDVYKVETIGDAYMVVSGLPIRNGNLHAREICRMSLSILDAVLSFKIGHMPNRQLKLRIGLHTGSVCAGVVGQKMPRYCLFGDTVNTTSRMESNGLPLKIHVSPQTKEVLDTFHTFQLELRGPVEMKGKGEIITWWLLGENGR